MLILAVLQRGELSASQIADEIEQRTRAKLRVKSGSLWPGLKRLVGDGCVVQRVASVDATRQSYVITSVGTQTYRKLRTEWRRSSSAVDLVLVEQTDSQTATQHFAPGAAAEWQLDITDLPY